MRKTYTHLQWAATWPFGLLLGLPARTTIYGQQRTFYIGPVFGTGKGRQLFPRATMPIGSVQVGPKKQGSLGLIKLFSSDEAYIDSLFIVQGNLGASTSPGISELVGVYSQSNGSAIYPYIGHRWKMATKVRQTPCEVCLNKPNGDTFVLDVKK